MVQEEGAASAKVLWYAEQGIRELTEDQGAEWEGKQVRLGFRQGQAAHKREKLQREAWGGFK